MKSISAIFIFLISIPVFSQQNPSTITNNQADEPTYAYPISREVYMSYYDISKNEFVIMLDVYSASFDDPDYSSNGNGSDMYFFYNNLATFGIRKAYKQNSISQYYFHFTCRKSDVKSIILKYGSSSKTINIKDSLIYGDMYDNYYRECLVPVSDDDICSFVNAEKIFIQFDKLYILDKSTISNLRHYYFLTHNKQNYDSLSTFIYNDKNTKFFK